MGGLFVSFDPNDVRKCIKIQLCTNKVVIYGKEKKC